jgi:hypothetical protein
MRAVGKQGNSYLLIQPDDIAELDKLDRPPARVYDADTGVLSSPVNIHRILKFGGWEEFDLADAQVRELLAGVVTVYGAGIDEPWRPVPAASERLAAEEAVAEKAAA